MAQFEGLEISNERLAQIDALVAGLGSESRALGRASGATRAYTNHAREAFEAIRSYIEDRVFFERISAAEIVEIWENAQDQFIEGSEERNRVERELFTARRNLNQEIAAEEQRLHGEAMNLLQQRIDAEQSLKSAIESRTNALYSSAIRSAGIDRILTNSTEERARAFSAAYDSIADAERRLNTLNAGEARNRQQLQRNIITAQERHSAALSALAEASAENRVQAERQVEDAVWALENARDAAANAHYEREQERLRLNQQIADQRQALYDAEIEKQKSYGALMLESLDSQIAEYELRFESLETIFADTNITTAMLDHMGLLAPGMAEELAKLANALPEYHEGIVERFGRLGELSRNKAILELEEMHEEVIKLTERIYYDLGALINEQSPEIGTAFVRGLYFGINENAEELLEAEIRRVARENVIGATMDELDMSSPSKAAYDIGANFIAGMENGILDRARPMQNSLMDFLRRMVSDATATLVRDGFNAGAAFGDALGQGLISREGDLLRQAESTAALRGTAFFKFQRKDTHHSLCAA